MNTHVTMKGTAIVASPLVEQIIWNRMLPAPPKFVPIHLSPEREALQINISSRQRYRPFKL